MSKPKDKELLKDYEALVFPIISANRVHQMDLFIQHGKTSTLDHVMSVAWTCLYLNRKLHLKVDEKSLMRVAILHDYYLYDWHIPDPKRPGLHGFTHGPLAAKLANADFGLSDHEHDAIYHHMFPLVAPPKHKLGWILTLVDKYVSTREVFVTKISPELVAIKERALKSSGI